MKKSFNFGFQNKIADAFEKRAIDLFKRRKYIITYFFFLLF